MRKFTFPLFILFGLASLACGDDVTSYNCPDGQTYVDGECQAVDIDGQGNANCKEGADILVLINDSQNSLAIDVDSLELVNDQGDKIIGEKPLGYPVGAYVLPNVNVCQTFWGNVIKQCYVSQYLVPVKINSDTLAFSLKQEDSIEDCLAKQVNTDSLLAGYNTCLTERSGDTEYCCALFSDSALDMVCGR